MDCEQSVVLAGVGEQLGAVASAEAAAMMSTLDALAICLEQLPARLLAASAGLLVAAEVRSSHAFAAGTKEKSSATPPKTTTPTPGSAAAPATRPPRR